MAEFGDVMYMETSSATGEVSQAFQWIAEEANEPIVASSGQ